MTKINTDFDGDQSEEDIVEAFNRKVQTPGEPVLQGDTTFGLNVEWINWYCEKHGTAVWKARKEGKRRLAKLRELKARFNK